MVPSPTRLPSAASFCPRSSASARTASATGAPSRSRAVMWVGPLVVEVSFAGEHHGQAQLVGPGDVLLVPHGPPGLDDHRDPGRRGGFDPVGERIERVAGARTAGG